MYERIDKFMVYGGILLAFHSFLPFVVDSPGTDSQVFMLFIAFMLVLLGYPLTALAKYIQSR